MRDVGVIERCEGLRLTREPRQTLGIAFEDLVFDEPWLVVDLIVNSAALEAIHQEASDMVAQLSVVFKLICDLFSREARGRMLAFFYVAIPVGSALGYALGELVAHSPLTWRWAFWPLRSIWA